MQCSEEFVLIGIVPFSGLRHLIAELAVRLSGIFWLALTVGCGSIIFPCLFFFFCRPTRACGHFFLSPNNCFGEWERPSPLQERAVVANTQTAACSVTLTLKLKKVSFHFLLWSITLLFQDSTGGCCTTMIQINPLASLVLSVTSSNLQLYMIDTGMRAGGIISHPLKCTQ